MKPTSANVLIASLAGKSWLLALVVCSALAFFLGQRSVSVPDPILVQFD